jgi:hypothetical protein
VRIMPYRTLDDRIDGVVITFADITVAKTLEARLREKHAVLEKRVAKETAERASVSRFTPLDATALKPDQAGRKSRRSRKP